MHTYESGQRANYGDPAYTADVTTLERLSTLSDYMVWMFLTPC